MANLIKQLTISYRLDKARKRNMMTKNFESNLANRTSLSQAIQTVKKDEENMIPENVIINLTSMGKNKN